MMKRSVKRLIAFAMIGAVTLSAHAANDANITSLLDAGHFNRARPLIEARIQKNPNDAEARYFMSRIKESSDDMEAAIDQAQQAVNLDPNKGVYHMQLGQLYGTKAQRSSMFSALKFAKLIKSEGETALRLDPKLADAYELLIQYYLQAPGIAGGDKNRAYQLLDQLFKFDPERGNLIRADLAVKDKQEDKAESFYKNAILASPNSYGAQSALANWYLSKKKYDLAEKAARDLIKIDGGRIGGYLFLAILYATQERWADLDSVIAEAKKNVPDDLGPVYQAARILFTNGKDLQRAERYLKSYLSQEPEIGAPTLAHAHWRLGLVYEKEGRKPEAIQELQTAINMKPDLEVAKKDLKRMK